MSVWLNEIKKSFVSGAFKVTEIECDIKTVHKTANMMDRIRVKKPLVRNHAKRRKLHNGFVEKHTNMIATKTTTCLIITYYTCIVQRWKNEVCMYVILFMYCLNL